MSSSVNDCSIDERGDPGREFRDLRRPRRLVRRPARRDDAAESTGRGFGSSALKVDGSIFAMRVAGLLVVTLPATGVVTLIADGTGTPFDANKGTPMKEWLKVLGDDSDTWLRLADEARRFVGR